MAVVVHRDVLSNGLRVLVAPQPHLHTATLAAYVKVGSRFEARSDNGLSHFLEHMFFRGTERHPSAYALNHAIESLGGTLQAATYADFTSYMLNVPVESLPEAIRLLGDVFRSPVFSEIEHEKGIVREEILEALDEDGRSVDVEDISRALVFGAHPLGQKIAGDATNVGRFTVEDLRRHAVTHYGATNMLVTLTGAVERDAVLPIVADALGPLARGTVTTGEPPTFAHAGPAFSYVDSQGSQTDVRISFVTPGDCDPRRPVLDMLLRVLDDGMSTRLHRRIADDQGLAYEVFARTDLYEDCGVFDLGASVEHDKTPELVRELFVLAAELRDHAVTPEELEKARRRYAWDMRAALDDGTALASFHGVRHMMGRPEETLETAVAAFHAVTADDLRELAREVFQPERLSVTAVGVLEDDVLDETRATVAAFR